GSGTGPTARWRPRSRVSHGWSRSSSPGPAGGPAVRGSPTSRSSGSSRGASGASLSSAGEGRRLHMRAALLLAALYLALALHGLGGADIVGDDEAREAGIVQDVVAGHGDWPRVYGALLSDTALHGPQRGRPSLRGRGARCGHRAGRRGRPRRRAALQRRASARQAAAVSLAGRRAVRGSGLFRDGRPASVGTRGRGARRLDGAFWDGAFRTTCGARRGGAPRDHAGALYSRPRRSSGRVARVAPRGGAGVRLPLVARRPTACRDGRPRVARRRDARQGARRAGAL